MLGYRVRDKMTGFEGIAVSRTEWLHGCVRVSVQIEELKDGKLMDPIVFDEPQLEVIAPTQFAVISEPAVKRKTGGPSPMPNQPPKAPSR